MLIYCIKNKVNDKCYIGQTIRSFDKRKYVHVYQLNKGIHNNEFLQNAWNKYGEENFKIYILEDEFKKRKELCEAEKFWIDVLFSYYPYGYNLTYGGEKYKKTQIIKNKISNSLLEYHKNNEYDESRKNKISKSLKQYYKDNDPWNKDVPISKKQQKRLLNGWKKYLQENGHPRKGKKHRKESIEKMSKSTIQWYRDNESPMKGKTHTEEAKRKMSERHWDCSGKNNPMYGKKSYSKKCMIIKTGQIFESLGKLAEYVGIHSSTVSDHCNGKRKIQKYKFVGQAQH